VVESVDLEFKSRYHKTKAKNNVELEFEPEIRVFGIWLNLKMIYRSVTSIESVLIFRICLGIFVVAVLIWSLTGLPRLASNFWAQVVLLPQPLE
jgi:hypothetical protein